MYVHVKVVVIYQGISEHVYRLALAATDGAWDSGAEVRIRRIGPLTPHDATHERPEPTEFHRETRCMPEVDAEDLAWADVALVGTATAAGAVPHDLAQLVEAAAAMWRSGELAEKVYGAFTPATAVHDPHGPHGGRSVSLLDVFHHWGGIVVPLGLRDAAARQLGHPLGASRLAVRGSPLQIELAAARSQGERATETARALKLGRRLLADVA
jgi:NAD(P)H dehydrogenase (quinone)